jgi:hypothetical protein
VGAAAHRSSGEVRLVLTSAAAAAALYGAVVLFGLGPSSPLALDLESARPQPAVHVRVHDLAAPDPVAREPQPLPGGAQQPARIKRLPQPTHSVRPVLVQRTEAQASPQTHPSGVAALPVSVPTAAPPRPEAPVAVAVVVPTLPSMSLPPVTALPVLTP